MKSLNKEKNISLFLILFIINITISFQEYKLFPLKYNFINCQLDNFNIEIEEDKRCTKWIPSIFNSFSLITKKTESGDCKQGDSYNIKNPLFSDGIEITFFHNFTFLEKFPILIGKIRWIETFKYCYLGLLNQIGNSPINESQIFLNEIKNQYIEKKIFSFDKWIIDNNISSNFYLGDNHQNFTSKTKDGIMGTCKADKVDGYWGCFFNNMSYNNNTIDLKKKNNKNELYRVLFSSENFNIIFPLDFEEKFNIITNNLCTYETDIEGKMSNLSCSDFFIGNKEFFSLTLSDDNMDITIEIDNLYRFTEKKDEKRSSTRISYRKDIDYFILPLSMFKNFHVQFNAEDNLIRFYTTDHQILKLKNHNNQNEKKSSKGLKAFLVILIILLILALGYGIFWLLKRRKGDVNKSINKYNKFEDEEGFKDMNEKRVF